MPRRPLARSRLLARRAQSPADCAGVVVIELLELTEDSSLRSDATEDRLSQSVFARASSHFRQLE
jgi:hypothetical protein